MLINVGKQPERRPALIRAPSLTPKNPINPIAPQKRLKIVPPDPHRVPAGVLDNIDNKKLAVVKNNVLDKPGEEDHEHELSQFEVVFSGGGRVDGEFGAVSELLFCCCRQFGQEDWVS